MSQQTHAAVLANDELIANHRVLRLFAPEIAAVARPGHFVNALAGDDASILRKPFSIYAADKISGEISLLFSIYGPTTRAMAAKRIGETLDVFGPLGGRLFEPDKRQNAAHVMVGGGYGVPPLVFLAKRLKDENADVTFVTGARRADLLLCQAELAAAGVSARTVTEDGSCGTTGKVTDCLAPMLEQRAGAPTTVYCCGPTPMMRAVGELCQSAGVPCQLSMEVPMPCGVGVCMGCVLDLTDGRRVRCCTDGPVFEATEITW